MDQLDLGFIRPVTEMLKSNLEIFVCPVQYFNSEPLYEVIATYLVNDADMENVSNVSSLVLNSP